MRKLTKIFASIALILSTSSCSGPQLKSFSSAMQGGHYKPLNILPMYGAPEKTKTKKQKKIDKDFIEAIEKSEGSRKVGAKRFAVAGWMKRQKGDWRTAMMRFNQSWLLDPNYYQAYWGFGTLMLDDKKPKKAIEFLEKSLSLLDEENEKPRLLVELARAHSIYASSFKDKSSKEAKTHYEQSNHLINEALKIDPDYGNAYRIGALSAFRQEDYRRAWDIVIKAEKRGSYKFNTQFMDSLSSKMPRP